MATKISEFKLLGFSGLLFVLALLAFPAQGFAQSPPKFVYVANAGSDNVSAYTMDATTGALSPVTGSPFAAGPSPIGVAVDPSGKFVYVTQRNPGGVAYSIDPATGALMPVPGSPFAAGTAPERVAVDPSGKFAYVTNNGSYNVSAYTIDATSGALTPVVGSPFAAASNVAGVAVHPSGKFLYVTNQASANVSAYSIDATSGVLTPIAGSPFAAVAWTTGAAVDPSGKFLYVTNFGSANVSAYTIDGGSGALTPVAGSPFAVGNNPFQVAVDPSGRFVYVANGSSGNVSAFPIDAGSGALTPVLGSPFAAGSVPFALTVDPSGRFVYVANGSSGNVSAFPIDAGSGALTPVLGSPFAAGSFPFGVAVTPACVPPPAGLVSWWRGEGDARDATGSDDGTAVNGTTFASGRVGQGFSFDGLDDGVVIPDSPSFDMTDFTLDAWIKTTDAGSGRRRIISQQQPSGNHFWVMSLFDNQLEACSATSNGVLELGDVCEAFTGQTLNDGQFHHVAITRKSGAEIRWYIDGVNVKTHAIANTGSFAIAADVFIGKLDPIVEAFYNAHESFNGLIDEVEIFNRALSSSEIQRIFNAGPKGKCPCVPPPSGMVAWWPGEGSVNDIVGGNNGTLQNGATFGPGEVGQAFSLNGAAQWVDLGTNVGSFGADDFTIDYWILWHSLDGEQVMIEKWDNGPGFGGTALSGWTFTKTGTTFQFGGAAGGGYTPVNFSVPGLNTEAWHHFAVTRSSGLVTIYWDSAVIATVVIPNIDPTPNPLTLGRRSDGRGLFHNGLIDEVEVFNRALSSDEIYAIYNAGGAGKCKPVANAGPNQTVEATSPAGASVTLDGSGSYDPDGDTLTYTWTGPFGTASGVNPTVTVPLGPYTITLTVKDSRGVTASATVLITVQDTIAPAIECDSADGLWHANNVSINCTATDGGSGPALQNVTLSTSVAAGTENANASTNSQQVCDAVGNCATAGPVGGNMIDRKAPSIFITAPTASTYLLNQSAASGYSCSDGGSGTATCAGPVASGSNFDTASAGAKSFTVTAADNVGNSTSSTVNYTVGYAAAGMCFGSAGHAILQPVNSDGTSVFKKGSTVPAKFRVCDASGNSVGSPGVVSSFRLIQTITGTVSDVDEAVYSTTPDAAFRWDANAMQWIFNINTKTLSAGTTYVYRVTLNDGSTIDFQFGLK